MIQCYFSSKSAQPVRLSLRKLSHFKACVRQPWSNYTQCKLNQTAINGGAQGEFEDNSVKRRSVDPTQCTFHTHAMQMTQSGQWHSVLCSIYHIILPRILYIETFFTFQYVKLHDLRLNCFHALYPVRTRVI